MKLVLFYSVCKICIFLPLKQFKKKDGGLFLNNLKCVNCQTVLEIIDLSFK